MARFGLVLYRTGDNRGRACDTWAYREGEEPPAEALPQGTEFVWIEDTHPQYDLAYRICVDDDTVGYSTYAKYNGLGLNGPRWNFDTQEFDVFPEYVDPEDLITKVRRIRDEQLDASDYFMLLDDLPESMETAVTAFRSELRDMPTKVTSGEWTDERDIIFSAPPLGLHDFDHPG